MTANRKPRIVTPEQYAEGYSIFVDGVIILRPWNLLWRRPDGNYVVTYREDEVKDNPSHLPIVDAR